MPLELAREYVHIIGCRFSCL